MCAVYYRKISSRRFKFSGSNHCKNDVLDIRYNRTCLLDFEITK